MSTEANRLDETAEYRIDPDDGNAYRKCGGNPSEVCIEDVHGGHVRVIPWTSWEAWSPAPTFEPDPSIARPTLNEVTELQGRLNRLADNPEELYLARVPHGNFGKTQWVLCRIRPRIRPVSERVMFQLEDPYTGTIIGLVGKHFFTEVTRPALEMLGVTVPRLTEILSQTLAQGMGGSMGLFESLAIEIRAQLDSPQDLTDG